MDNMNTPNITHWNYRVVKQTVDGYARLGVHEVYFCNDEVVTMTNEPIDMVEYLRPEISGAPSPIDELREAAQMVLEACDKPILDWDTLNLTQDNYIDSIQETNEEEF